MTVLVTGATGFIGEALTRTLLAVGERVRVLARKPERVAGAGLAVAEVTQGDVTDPAAVDRAVDGVDTIYAIAGTFREPSLSDERYHEVNVGAVRLMMEAAKRHGVRRVVHCSTVGIHGNVVGPPASEATPLRPDGFTSSPRPRAISWR
jgi:dihydroflavonol-4-reductase